MSGVYADVPNHRIAYDADGSICWFYASSVATSVMSQAQVNILNNENDDYIDGSASDVRCFIFFPQPYDITGVHVNVDASSGWLAEYSLNTSNGVDGTWTSFGATANSGSASPVYRTSIQAVSLTAVKAIRFGTWGPVWNRLRSFHVYGTPNASSAKQLRLWHPTTDTALGGAYFDQGDILRSTTATQQFRLKNISSMTASSITLTTEALTDFSPTFNSQHQLSTDNSSFSNSISISNLSAGSISPILYMKRTTSASAVVGLYDGRIKIQASFA